MLASRLDLPLDEQFVPTYLPSANPSGLLPCLKNCYHLPTPTTLQVPRMFPDTYYRACDPHPTYSPMPEHVE